MIDGFENDIRDGYYRVVRIFDNGKQTDYTEETLALQMGRAHTLRIEPVAAGAAGKQGIFSIVLGAALIGAAFLLTGGALGATALSIAGMNITGTQLALVGGLMAFSGVSAMLAPAFEQPTDENKERNSAMVSTPTNKTEQGHPVPLVYGRDVFVGSVVAANAVYVEDWDNDE